MENLASLLGHARLLYGKGKIAEAEQLYIHILAGAPGEHQALQELGIIRYHQGRHKEALALVDASLALMPQNKDALINRGNILRALGRPADALENLRKALEIVPDSAEALYNQGVILSEGGAHEDALASYDNALKLRPEFRAAVLNNKGSALWKLRRFEESLAALDQALSFRPDYIDALNNRGVLLRDMHQYPEAIANFDKVLSIDNANAEAWYNRGNTLFDLERLAEARDCYIHALICNPDHRHAPSQLASVTLRLCDWPQVPRMGSLLRSHVVRGQSNVAPFALLGFDDDPLLQQECALAYVRRRIPFRPPPLWTGRTYRHHKIKVAYLSSDFRRHATASLLAELIERHDRNHFEVIGVSFGPDDDSPMRKRLSCAFDQFHDARGLGDSAVAQLLRRLETDIAVDLHGHTQGSRLEIFSHRPAPVQVNYLGFPGTIGANFIDYIIADRVVLPPDQQKFFTEKIVYLPDSYQVNDSKRPLVLAKPSREVAGLPSRHGENVGDGFVFCCFNANWKIAAPVFDVWMRLLAKVPGSVLWLIEDNPVTCANLRVEAKNRGVDSRRLIFARRTDPESHLARHQLADLFLDTKPVNAHTTASDALWTGLPLLTCRGHSFSGRVAASLLCAVGLPELVTSDLEGYESLALKLATNPEALQCIRQRLVRQRLETPLFDLVRFRKNLEAAYTKMWQIAERGEAPENFSV